MIIIMLLITDTDTDNNSTSTRARPVACSSELRQCTAHRQSFGPAMLRGRGGYS